jgi:DNA-binding response OmpR family regulator
MLTLYDRRAASWLNKVPDITLAFWIIKIMSATVGEMLLDLGLPGQDGHEVLAGIRAQDGTVPLIVVTARDELDDRLRGLDGGADDYVLKPFEMGAA